MSRTELLIKAIKIKSTMIIKESIFYAIELIAMIKCLLATIFYTIMAAIIMLIRFIIFPYGYIKTILYILFETKVDKNGKLIDKEQEEN